MSISDTRKAIRELPDDKDGITKWFCDEWRWNARVFTYADLKELEAAYERLLEAAKMALSAPELKLTRDVLKDAVSREDPPSAEARATPSGEGLSESGS